MHATFKVICIKSASCSHQDELSLLEFLKRNSRLELAKELEIRSSGCTSIVWHYPDQEDYHVPVCLLQHEGRNKTPGRAVCKIERLMVSKRWGEINQDKNLGKRLMQSIPKSFPGVYLRWRQADTKDDNVNNQWISGEFFSVILCNSHQFNSIAFLRVHPLVQPITKQIEKSLFLLE